MRLQAAAHWRCVDFVSDLHLSSALPLTTSQKVQRADLRQLAASLPGQEVCIDTRHLKKRQTA